MFQFFISGIYSGLRGRSFQAVFLLGILTIVVAYLAGNFSPRQPRTVALDMGFSGIRLSLVLLNLFWVQELVTREIERRTILLSLTYPVPRAYFVFGRYGAVVVLSFLAAMVLGLLLTLAVVFAGGKYQQDYPPSLGGAFWVAVTGFALDAAVVAAFATCLAALSTVAALPLALGVAFAVGGKALGYTLDYIRAGADGDQELVASVDWVLDLARWVLPDLSRLDWRDWALYQVYPGGDAILMGVALGIAYAGMMITLAALVLQHREFS